MRILIYGVGVIGSLYAALFAEAGYDTSIYARGKRLEFLKIRIFGDITCSMKNCFAVIVQSGWKK